MFDIVKIYFTLSIALTLLSCTTSNELTTRTEPADITFQQLKTEGRLLGLDRKFFQAIEKLDQAASLKPDDPHVHLMLGEAYFHVGNGQNSLTHLERSRELAPNNYQIESWLGTINIELGKLNEAEIAYTNVLAIKPNDYNALVYMGYIAFHKRDYPTCQEYFERYKRLVDIIEPARLTEKEKARYQQATEYSQACATRWRHDTRKLRKSL